MEDPMPPSHALVRRRPQSLSAPFAAELAPPRFHPGGAFCVESEVLWPAATADGALRGPPALRLRWEFPRGSTGTVVGFRRRDGFGKDGDFGACVVTCNGPGEQIEHLEPGDYYYTFCTRHDVWGLARVYRNPVSFAETVPSPARVLELMRQAVEYKKLQIEYGKLTAPEPAPVDPLDQFEKEFNKALAGVDARLGAEGRLRDKWAAAKEQIEDSDASPGEKKRRLRALGGIMRRYREQFEL